MLWGETTSKEAARKHGLKVAEIEDRQEKFLAEAENACAIGRRDDDALRNEEIKNLKLDDRRGSRFPTYGSRGTPFSIRSSSL